MYIAPLLAAEIMTRQIYKPALTILLFLVTAATTNQEQSAVQRFQTLQESVRKARDAKDWRSNVASAGELKEFMNGAPDSLLELARGDPRSRIGRCSA